MTRYLIVNADDFGRSPAINRGIIGAHERGIVTSASLMVRHPAAREAADYARAHSSFSVGLHVDLSEWVYRDGEWQPVYEVTSTTDGDAVVAELHRQLTAFQAFMGRDPTHLDSHQHVHRDEPVLSALRDKAGCLGAPLRHFTPSLRYCGSFFGQSGKGEPFPQGITVEQLCSILEKLPAGWTELCCHPGEGDDYQSSYQNERGIEVAALCDPRVRTTVAARGIQLRSFHDWPPTR